MAEMFINAAEVRNKIIDVLSGRVSSVTLNGGTDSSFLALSTTTPSYGEDGEITGFTEPSGEGYERYSLGYHSIPQLIVFSSASKGEAKNALEVRFKQATPGGSGWGTVLYWGVYTAQNGGTLLAAGKLTTPITVAAGQVAVLSKDALKITMNDTPTT